MKIKRSIFGSPREYELFKSLQNRWSKDFDLWPSLPFSCIVELEESEPILSPKERNYFYNSNIDYTLCTKNGQPVLSIEFDGLGKGFSRNGEYIQIKESRDPYRKLKMDLKIKIAKKLDYPFYVIAFEESEVLEPNLSLTIVDGIIGQVLAHKPKIYSAIYGILPSTSDDAELITDPIVSLSAKMMGAAFEKGIIKTFREEFLSDPKLPEGDLFDIAVIEARFEAIKTVMRVGCRVIVDTQKIAIVETVWVRNFEDNFVSPIHIARNIAEMLVFKKALDLIGKE